MVEPVYIAQTAEQMEGIEQINWINAKAREATETKGAAFFRVSKHKTIANLILIEAWEKNPGDQGKPRWR